MAKIIKNSVLFICAVIMAMMISILSGGFGVFEFSQTAMGAEITPQQPIGDGTAENPYQIGSAEELYWFAEQVNSGNNAINAVLIDNITVNTNVLDSRGVNESDFISWTPIGNSNNKYSGVFDGQGHTVSGLYFNDSSVDYVGFFGYIVDGATISNLSIADSYLSGKFYVGGICGESEGIIKNCQNFGEICAKGFVGGVIGDNNGTVESCKNSGAVTGEYDNVGGVCGNNNGPLKSCESIGEVNCQYNTGGICGCNSWGTIENCYYNSDIYRGKAVGYTGYGTETNVLGKTTAEFNSGEVAYLLQSDQAETVWAQTIGTDEYPELKVFSENSLKVAQLTTADSTVHYANEVEDGSIIVDGTGNQFKVVLNTNAYGGEGAKYLETVNIYNNNAALTDNSTAPMYYTYDENDNNLAVFTFTNQNTAAIGTIRAEVTTKENAEAETVLYFVSKEAAF